ncbi:hypothetical protein ACX1C1_03855 [Paenibacillus sp. strain BS8-2]
MEQDISFKRFIDTFLHNIEALREFTVRADVGISTFEPTPDLRLSELGAHSYQVIKDVQRNGIAASIEKYQDEQIEEKVDIFKQFLVTEFGLELADNGDIVDNNDKYEKIKSILNGMKSIDRKLTQKLILNQSSLINLVVFFELLIANIIKYRLFKYPDAANLKDKTLTIDEIRRLGNFENAEAYLIENEVEGIIRQKHQEWFAYFKKNLKTVNFDFMTRFEAELNEIIQRRNLFVHNEGIINNIYLSNVNSALTNGLKKGKYLKMNNSYLNQSINVIEHIGLLISLELWRAMEKKSEVRWDFCSGYGYELLMEGRWELANDVYKFFCDEKESGSENKSIALINYWLTMKKLGKYSEIKSTAERADFSDKRDRYQLSYYSIIEDRNNFYHVLHNLTISRDVRKVELLEWPVLYIFRDEPEFQDFVAKYDDGF